jgi:Na+-driven multidrug efflux pump
MLIGAIFTALLDPIFIFGCGLGIEGAAIASSIARIALLLTGLNGAMRVHNLIAFSGFRGMWSDTPAIMRVAVPAVITNLATPFANAYVTGAMAKFGDGAVSGSAIIGRLLPVAFVGTFALTGSVGPILGQNLGAGLFPRVRGAFTDALIFAAVYTLGAWLLLALTYPEINLLMKANGEAGEITAFFCRWLTPLFGFLGGLFVATAAFNNLGRPRLPSYINWGRATAGTVPFVMLGAHLGGAKGIMLGQALGSALFSLFAVYLCYRYVGRLETTPREQFYAAKSDEPQASEAAMS